MQNFREIKISKGNGKYRTVVAPDAATKARLRVVGARVTEKVLRLPTASVVHGFVPGRSPVTNAAAHVGHAYTICFDLTDFFDHVTADKVRGKLSTAEAAKALYQGRAAQGLPSSPAVANLAAADMDSAILRALEKNKRQAVYTRYADDLTFSCDDAGTLAWLRTAVPHIASRCGFAINAAKTHAQMARSGRRVITGVAVGADGVFPTRSAKRRLRAALHQGNAAQARGLAEWLALKAPRARAFDATALERAASYRETARVLAAFWNLRLPKTVAIHPKDEVADGDFLITGDPAYTLGMSTFTTGWRSCMHQPDGRYRRGVLQWLMLAGTRIAAIVSDRTATFGGITRRVMRARCLVHTLRHGAGSFYDRAYGDQESIAQLHAWLEERGIRSLSNAPHHTRVVGNVPRLSRRPYCDTLRAGTGSADGRRVTYYYVP